MEEYKKAIKSWYYTKLFINIILLLGVVICGVVGVYQEKYLITITIVVLLGVVWLILNELTYFLKPVPPMKIIPMPLPPKEKDDESSKN